MALICVSRFAESAPGVEVHDFLSILFGIAALLVCPACGGAGGLHPVFGPLQGVRLAWSAPLVHELVERFAVRSP